MGQRQLEALKPVLLLLLLLVVCSARGVGAENCEGEEPCPGHRPRNPQGCCPALPLEACGESVHCDALLGYRCLDEDGREGPNGICKGAYGLRVETRSQRELALDWDDFLPSGYMSEYSLRYRPHNYSDLLSSWTNITIGDSSQYTLRNLVPATWYFIRVGVFSGPYSTTYVNLSETLLAQTRAVENCRHMGKEYSVGQTFDNECEDRCTCLASGDFDCKPLCPNQTPVRMPSDRSDCTLRHGPDCCLTVFCPASDEGCEVNGTEYSHASEWVDGCRQCQCLNGEVRCGVLEAECLTPQRSEACPNPTSRSLPGQCCPVWECGKTCTYHSVVRESGAQWEEEGCERCTCENGEVTCVELCPDPETPANCSRPLRRPLSGSCCYVIECLPPVKSCVHNNETIHRGNYFTNEACELCMCTVNGSIECSLHCAPLPLPAPSPVCPNPTLRKQGCCDTLWCDDPQQDIIATIRNLFATSFGPHSLTLSFQVAPAANSEGEDNSIYEMLYAEESAVLRWERVTVRARPPDDEGGEGALRPAQLLQTTGVLRVADRVYVTLSGMQANTTYYVKIRPLETDGSESQDAVGQEDNPATTSATPSYAGAVVVKTLASDTTCVHEGNEYREGDEFSSSCGQECRCVTGRVQCWCREDGVVLLPSPSCPRPRLQTSPDSCCPSWVCFPEENGCRYKNYLLRDGEDMRVGCQEVCHCAAGAITCSPLCSDPGPAPREACELRNLTAHCCPVWMCPPERRPPVGVSVTLLLEMSGSCTSWDEEAALTFEHAFRQRWRDVICSHDDAQEICEGADVTVNCPSLLPPHRSRRRRQAIFGVDVILSIPVTGNAEVSEVSARLTEVARNLTDRLLTSNVTLTLATVTYTVTSAFLEGASLVCEQNYIAFNHSCMPVLVSQPPSSSPEPHNISLTVLTLGPHYVTLAWYLRMPSNHVTGIFLEFREVTCPVWNQTEMLSVNVTWFKLQGLNADQEYQVRLILEYSPLDRYPSQPLAFRTSPSQEVLVVDVRMRELSVGSTSVTLRWVDLGDAAQTSRLTLTYGRSDHAPVTSSSVSLPPGADSCVLEGLAPDTLYWARLHLSFRNGTQAQSGLLHFLTRPAASPSSLMVPLVVSVAVVVCAILVVLVTCCLWRRSRRKENLDTAFENKVFGIQIQNEGRTLNARA